MHLLTRLEFSGIKPRRWAMNSSGRTEVLEEMETRSMERVGTSASMARRREFARERCVRVRTKSTCEEVAYVIVSLSATEERAVLEARTIMRMLCFAPLLRTHISDCDFWP